MMDAGKRLGRSLRLRNQARRSDIRSDRRSPLDARYRGVSIIYRIIVYECSNLDELIYVTSAIPGVFFTRCIRYRIYLASRIVNTGSSRDFLCHLVCTLTAQLHCLLRCMSRMRRVYIHREIGNAKHSVVMAETWQWTIIDCHEREIYKFRDVCA